MNVLIDPSTERSIIDFRALGLQHVIALGRYCYAHAHRPLAHHTHGRMIELCFLDEGIQPYVVGENQYVLKGGDILVTFPNEVHGTGNNPENRGRLYWLMIQVPKPRERFLNLPAAESRALINALLSLNPRHFKGNRLLKHYLERVFEAHQGNSDLKRAEIENWLLRFLLDVVSSARKAFPQVSPEIRAVLTRITERLPDEVPLLEHLADMAHLSLSRFKARFKKEVGLSPGNYIMQNRIDAAKRYLADTESVTNISLRLGFSSSQYFATVFKRYTGCSPLQFRQHIASRTQKKKSHHSSR